MTFVETRFPVDISYGSSGGPEFSTDVVMTQGGYEQRNVNWSQARGRYNIAHGVKSQEQLDALIAFFRARRGRAEGFRFKDWTDYQAIGIEFGEGDGVETAFQLIKLYTDSGVTVNRTVTKPVADSESIYVNSVLKSSPGDYSLNTATGIVTFTSPPANGAVLSADFEFDVPVRFDTDRLSASLDSYGSYSWKDIPLIEIRL